MDKFFSSHLYIIARGTGSVPYAKGKWKVITVMVSGKDRRWRHVPRSRMVIYSLYRSAQRGMNLWRRPYRADSVVLIPHVVDLTWYRPLRKLPTPWFPEDPMDQRWIQDVWDWFQRRNASNPAEGQMDALALVLWFAPHARCVTSWAKRAWGNETELEWAILNHLHSVVLAQELLHLAGADDLYDKTLPRTVFPGDLFWEVHEDQVEKYKVGLLTAFAIGWIDTVPNLPVALLEFPPWKDLSEYRRVFQDHSAYLFLMDKSSDEDRRHRKAGRLLSLTR